MTTRLVHVDALRGFAVFGILVVNVAFFASGYAFHLVDDPGFTSGADHAVHWLVRLLFEMKAYLLFSFLFGYSFILQLDSATRSGADIRARTIRRAAGLFVIGGLHAVLLFHGDILTTYALLSLVLLAAHRIRPRTAVIVAGVIVGLIALGIAASSPTRRRGCCGGPSWSVSRSGSPVRSSTPSAAAPATSPVSRSVSPPRRSWPRRTAPRCSGSSPGSRAPPRYSHPRAGWR